MSIQDHKWSDEYISNAFESGGVIRVYNKDDVNIDFNKADVLAMAKHFKLIKDETDEINKRARN